MAESTPIITLMSDRTVIRPGESATIRWHVEGVREVYFFERGEDWQGHGVAGVAERQVSPAQTTVYCLRVVMRDGSEEVRGVEVQVQQETRSLAHFFSADKTDILPGECVTFRWHVEGVKEVYFFAEEQGWPGHGVAGVAESQVCPAQTTTYRLRVVRVDGAVEEHGISVQVRIGDRIFAVDRVWIRSGECVVFRWHVEGVKAVYFHPENEPWQNHGEAGVAEKQVCLAATTTFCLRVIKADDSLEVHYITVNVV